ncbi:MAG: helix-turn-helix domain-containing protein [Spirochaetales bacterium]|nr:helix-turn-helix domain-containing protein [Spirochaetales bacterium]
MSCNGRTIPLSPHEDKLLRTLIRFANLPVSRGDLLRTLGYSPGQVSCRLVDAHISSLRRKIISCAGISPERRLNPIRSVRRRGYGLWNTM